MGSWERRRPAGPGTVVPVRSGIGLRVSTAVAGSSASSGVMTSFIVIALAALYAPVFAHAVDVWSADQEFSFGFLVPPITLVLLWLRRHRLRVAVGVGSNVGLVALLCGLALYIAGARSGIHAIGGASFAVTALGATAFLYGVACARVLLFPLGFATFGLVLYRGLLGSVGFTLQRLTARYAASAAGLIGVPVRRSGVDLWAGHFHFVVVEACSGLSSLLALLCLGSLIVGLVPAPLARRLVLMALIVPIVLAANVVRVTLVLALAQSFGLAVAHGFIHGFFSASLFLAALGLLVLSGSALGCFTRIGATA